MFEFDGQIIAAVRSASEFSAALDSHASAVFLLRSDVMSLGKLIAAKGDKAVFVHIDMTEGLGRDKKGLEFLKSLGADGVITTKPHLIHEARELGLVSVLRVFIIDSQSFETAVASVNSGRPDFAELMPGIIPATLAGFAQRSKVPVIAGGLVSSESEVQAALAAGAVAVSTGRPTLW